MLYTVIDSNWRGQPHLGKAGPDFWWGLPQSGCFLLKLAVCLQSKRNLELHELEAKQCSSGHWFPLSGEDNLGQGAKDPDSSLFISSWICDLRESLGITQSVASFIKGKKKILPCWMCEAITNGKMMLDDSICFLLCFFLGQVFLFFVLVCFVLIQKQLLPYSGTRS